MTKEQQTALRIYKHRQWILRYTCIQGILITCVLVPAISYVLFPGDYFIMRILMGYIAFASICWCMIPLVDLLLHKEYA
jgi:hypothetical protein